MKPTATPYLPKIYAIKPHCVAVPDAAASVLAHGAALGFDHVLLVATAEDLAGGGFDGQGLSAFAAACKKAKLRLLLDLNIASAPPDSTLQQSHPHWFGAREQDDLPDPRRAPRAARCSLRYDDRGIAAEAIAYWQARLRALVDAGVAGFRCLEVGAPPAHVWRELIGTSRAQGEPRFLAWTPGCPPQQLAGLADCGFDATFSSAAWWDYRARWLMEEGPRLAQVAPPIAFPDSPDASVIARVAGADDHAARQSIHRRALRLAGACGNGWLMPMGFEFGTTDCFAGAASHAAFDLSEEVASANAFQKQVAAKLYGAPLHFLSAPNADVAVLLRQGASGPQAGGEGLFIVANADTMHEARLDVRSLLDRAQGYMPQARLWPAEPDGADGADGALMLGAAEVQVFSARRNAPVLLPPARGKQATVAAARAPRIAIEAVSPTVDDGRFVAKRVVGETVHIEADVFVDGHEKLAVALLWRAADDKAWQETRMQALGNDRWAAALPLTRIGRYVFAIEAWKDAFATYRDELEKKANAGLNVALELEEGRLLVERSAQYAQEQGIEDAASALDKLAKSLKVKKTRDPAKATTDAERIAALLAEPTLDAMRAADARPFAVQTGEYRIDAERIAARFSSWYELFPRSQSGDVNRHGTFDDVIARLPAIAAMGFDTLYFPPIHPIGKKHRKGRNNSLEAGPDDPGSPYAIGSDEGGHDAIHPQLGTIEDFRRLRDAAAEHGLELALDFAIQCSPDHPWLKEHPDWFDWRPDGSIRYAENPPKKYQDIVNVDFYAEGAIPGLWQALRDVVLFWVKEGVRVFRVDNPHTKPLPFWEWMINDIRSRYPDTIFLSEAFTRPKMMYRLAKVGYSQSYTYFTWRHSKQEFTDYLTELTTTPVREFFRPHFFVNTPDINPYFLQRSGRPGFLIRAALATTLSGLWGMYSGFELCEGAPVPGKEEYLDSEKYEIRAWDWQRPGNIIAEITQLNRIRIENPALQSHLGVRFLSSSDEHILVFMKTSHPTEPGKTIGDNVLLVAINLDPFAAHGGSIDVPLWEFGRPDDGHVAVDDLVQGGRHTWQGRTQQIWLDPHANPYAIWRVNL